MKFVCCYTATNAGVFIETSVKICHICTLHFNPKLILILINHDNTLAFIFDDFPDRMCTKQCTFILKIIREIDRETTSGLADAEVH